MKGFDLLSLCMPTLDILHAPYPRSGVRAICILGRQLDLVFTLGYARKDRFHISVILRRLCHLRRMKRHKRSPEGPIRIYFGLVNSKSQKIVTWKGKAAVLTVAPKKSKKNFNP